MASSSKSQKVAQLIVKCFCGCTELTVEEVKRIYRLNTEQTLSDEKAIQILKSYLRTKRSGNDLLLTEIHIQIYEKFKEFKKQGIIIDKEQLDELANDLEMPYIIELKIAKAIEKGDETLVQECQCEVIKYCTNLIEDSSLYREYKQELLKKVRM